MEQKTLVRELLARLENGWNGLPDKPEETPELTLRELWCKVAGGIPQNGNEGLPELNGAGETLLRELVEKRLSNVPLAYLIGRKSFMGIDLLAGPGAMIPRKETEIVGRAAVETVKEIAREQEQVFVIDLCTGSGNLALLLAFNEPKCQVCGADLSEEAVELARQNSLHLGLDQRVKFFQGDLFAPFASETYFGSMDLITCNPPYISQAQVEKLPEEILDYEPHLAFDGGPFGVKVLTRLVAEAPRYLKTGGWLCFEVGLGQGKVMANLVKKSGLYADIETYADEKGEIRALRARSAVVS
jgi:release factor glutamine methyltransferase